MLYSLSYSFSDHSHQQKEKMIFSNRINFEGHFVTVNKNIASDKINARGIRTLTTLICNSDDIIIQVYIDIMIGINFKESTYFVKYYEYAKILYSTFELILYKR